MPGVLHSNVHCGFSREIGKMAFIGHPDLMTFADNDYGDIPDSLFQVSQFLLDSADSDCDLPDNEHPVDLITFLDSPDIDLENHFNQNSCADGCNACNTTKYSRCVSTRQDPFMGTRSTEHVEVSAGPSTSSSPIVQLVCPVFFDDSGSEEVIHEQDVKPFIAWNTPTKSEEENDYIVAKNPISWLAPLDAIDEDTSDMTFPDTPSPSAPSGTNTGDDSDVDIETITDAPRSADSCGYITQDSSPEISPSASPAPHRKFHSGVSAKSSNSTFRVANSTSLSATLANHSNFLGQKRKLAKDRKLTSCKSQSQTVYHHVLCNSNSVNFHDYAMSPGACHFSASTETGKPTVLSKRLYKRHVSVDVPGKEKQHHHNQLERNRRQKLADLFVDLRDEVPKIASQAKASKVLILKEATSYIRDLQKCDKQQEDDISKERRRKESLKNKLRHLQAQLSRQCVK